MSSALELAPVEVDHDGAVGAQVAAVALQHLAVINGRGVRTEYQFDPRGATYDGGGAERLSEVMGTHPQPDPSGRYVFFLDHYYRMQRMDLEDRSITALELSIGYANRDAWVVRADGVYALKRVAGKGEQTWGVHRWDLLVEPGGSAEIRTINTDKSSPIDLALLGVSIESQSTIYTTAELNGDIDVMLLEGL